MCKQESEMGAMEKEFMELLPQLNDENRKQFLKYLNTDKRYGASAILQQDLMDKITETIGDVYIIPSSTDEVLVFPVHYNGKPGLDPQMLQDMLVL